MKKGVIAKAIGGFYEIFSNDCTFICKARGAFRHLKVTPLPGDWVFFECQKEGYARITEILPRKNELVRPAVANIDKLFITMSSCYPEPDRLLTDKLLFACISSGIVPRILINKTDSAIESTFRILRNEYEQFEPILVSADIGTGVEFLKKEIQGNVCCFAGQSGVGKSSLINLLLESDVVKTGSLSVKTEHGKHTTRETRLYFCHGGVLLDTPGFSMYEPVSYQTDLLIEAYPEFKKAAPCRFNGCKHIKEPDCGVKTMVENGSISKMRYERYVLLNEEFELRRKHRYD